MYKIGDIEVMALQGLDLAVEKGEMLAIIGNSGSGKSTLMNIIGGLDRPTAGKIHVNGTDLLKLSDKEMMHYMRETIGFVWQNTARNMIPYLNAIDADGREAGCKPCKHAAGDGRAGASEEK